MAEHETHFNFVTSNIPSKAVWQSRHDKNTHRATDTFLLSINTKCYKNLEEFMCNI